MKKAEKKASKKVVKKATKDAVKKEQKKIEEKKKAAKVAPVKAAPAPGAPAKVAPLKAAPAPGAPAKVAPVKAAPAPVARAPGAPANPEEEESSLLGGILGDGPAQGDNEPPLSFDGIHELVGDTEGLEKVLYQAQEHLVAIAMNLLKEATDGALDFSGMGGIAPPTPSPSPAAP